MTNVRTCALVSVHGWGRAGDRGVRLAQDEHDEKQRTTRHSDRAASGGAVPPQNLVDRTTVDVSALRVELAYPDASLAVRVSRARTPAPPHRALQRHRCTVRAVDRPAIGQRLPRRLGAEARHPGPR